MKSKSYRCNQIIPDSSNIILAASKIIPNASKIISNVIKSYAMSKIIPNVIKIIPKQAKSDYWDSIGNDFECNRDFSLVSGIILLAYSLEFQDDFVLVWVGMILFK